MRISCDAEQHLAAVSGERERKPPSKSDEEP
jgi:hypothetical protein